MQCYRALLPWSDLLGLIHNHLFSLCFYCLIIVVLPYITLGVTEGVTTQSVPPQDDGVSLPIDVNFPFGSQIQSTVYVC